MSITDDERKTLRVYCMCDALAMELPILDHGGVLEPDDGECPECGAVIHSTIDTSHIIHFYADDGEREDVCELDWPQWALDAFEEGRHEYV